jgi:hypothetical protein
MIGRRLIKSVLLAVTVMAVSVGCATAASAAEPTKWVPSSHFGWKVDKRTGGDVCTVASGDECGRGEESGAPGGFVYPESVAVAHDGNVYVADTANHRVEELAASGAFVLMFGWDVDKTKVEGSAPQSERNICTAASGDVCQAGEEGTGLGGQLARGQDIAVDQESGLVYVLDYQDERVDEYTEDGEFVLTIGGEVNATEDLVSGAGDAEKNICTASSGDTCKPGLESAVESKEPGAFKPEGYTGNLLAIGPTKLVYVGDEGRVQKFEPDGKGAGEVSLAALSTSGKVTSLAVDSSGNLFVVDSAVAGIHEYSVGDVLEAQVIDPLSTSITALAIDSYGRLGLIEYQEPLRSEYIFAGFLYSTSGKQLGEFAPPIPGGMPGKPHALAFDVSDPAEPLSDKVYVVQPSGQEIEAYEPVLFPEIETCEAQQVESTSARLCAEVNPNGVSTRGFFVFGTPTGTQAVTSTAFEKSGNALETYTSQLTELVPNQTYKFAAVVEAEAEGEEKQAAGKAIEFHTTTPPPEVVGAPVVSFAKEQSAVLGGSLNPEHAATRYHFEYGACERLAECSSVTSTPEATASQYGFVGVTQEVRGLAPQTAYSFRLVANNEHQEERAGKLVEEGGHSDDVEEGHFTTAPALKVEADTGVASNVGSNGGVLWGTVNPGGQPATYRFELGVYAGSATHLGVVYSGPAGASTTAVSEALSLSGLQPGVTYAYRISIESGYGSAEGALSLFTTSGSPVTIAAPPIVELLSLPKIAFPKAPKPPKKKTKKPAKKKTTRKKGKARKANRGHTTKSRRKATSERT